MYFNSFYYLFIYFLYNINIKLITVNKLNCLKKQLQIIKIIHITYYLNGKENFLF